MLVFVSVQFGFKKISGYKTYIRDLGIEKKQKHESTT